MQGVGMASKACVGAVVVVACMAVQVGAWGSYSCSLTPVDKDRLVNATLKSAEQVNASVSSLEEKVDRILELLLPPGPPQAPWLPPPHPQGPTGRDAPGRRGRSDREERSKGEGEHVRSEQDNTGEDEHNRESERPRNKTKNPERDEQERRREETEEREKEEAETRLETTVSQKNEEEDNAGPKKGQCSVMVTDNHATIGMFYMNTYNHGHCANRYPITSPIRYCLGYCPTRTFVTRKEGIWGQGHQCKSCQPSRLETLRIPLECDDGFTFEKNFKNVLECECTKCRSLAG